MCMVFACVDPRRPCLVPTQSIEFRGTEVGVVVRCHVCLGTEHRFSARATDVLNHGAPSDSIFIWDSTVNPSRCRAVKPGCWLAAARLQEHSGNELRGDYSTTRAVHHPTTPLRIRRRRDHNKSPNTRNGKHCRVCSARTSKRRRSGQRTGGRATGFTPSSPEALKHL